MTVSLLGSEDGVSPNVRPGVCSIYHLQTLKQAFNLLVLLICLNREGKVKETETELAETAIFGSFHLDPRVMTIECSMHKKHSIVFGFPIGCFGGMQHLGARCP
jgi:hypothetical protein